MGIEDIYSEIQKDVPNDFDHNQVTFLNFSEKLLKIFESSNCKTKNYFVDFNGKKMDINEFNDALKELSTDPKFKNGSAIQFMMDCKDIDAGIIKVSEYNENIVFIQLITLGIEYFSRTNYVEKDYEKAKKYFEFGIEKYNSSIDNLEKERYKNEIIYAMTNLGYMYANGEGTEQDYQRAKELYEMAIEKGSSNALNNLGYMYANGKGTEQDYQRAKEYYEMAIEKGNSNAMNNLGWMYYRGVGVEKDYQKAREYYEMAIEKGNTLAMCNLAKMYENGEGVEKDLVKAKELFDPSNIVITI